MSRILLNGLALSVIAAAVLWTAADAQPIIPADGATEKEATVRVLSPNVSADAQTESRPASTKNEGTVAARTLQRDGLPMDWEEVIYEGRPHIKVTTPRAVYFYDRAGGGLSRIIDGDGHDWIGWHPKPDEYPAGAAGLFRGIPNYQDGPGHPGYDACESQVDESSSERIVVGSTCREGSWTYTWTFYPHYAKNHIVSTPENVWFLYEGPIAGRYAPRDQYWGNANGRQTVTPNWLEGEQERGNWQWAYFGDEQVDRVLFLAMEAPYTEKAVFGYLGAVESEDTPELGLDASEGMIVFGFGREDYPDKHIVGDDKTFYLGFIEQKVTDSASHDEAAQHIQKVLESGAE
jgi:hypothetical protein